MSSYQLLPGKNLTLCSPIRMAFRIKKAGSFDAKTLNEILQDKITAGSFQSFLKITSKVLEEQVKDQEELSS